MKSGITRPICVRFVPSPTGHLHIGGGVRTAILEAFSWLGWSYGDQEVFTREELIRYFSLKNIGAKALDA